MTSPSITPAPSARFPNATVNLPTAVTGYFTLMEGADKRATIDVFHPDARVTDDGQTYLGRPEILRWLSGAASEYTVTSTRLGAEAAGDTATVIIRLDGNFPGGTVILRNVFTLSPAGLISTLTIAP